MNGQLLELWSRYLNAALQGQNQMDIMNGWWLRCIQGMSSMDKLYSSMPAMSNGFPTKPYTFDGFPQAWESISKMQQFSLQLMGMGPRNRYKALNDRVEELENRIREQEQTIERLRNLLRNSGSENNAVVTQLQDLIGQQSQQFKQITQSVSDYFKSSTETMSAKK